jgi:hypothetical protein
VAGSGEHCNEITGSIKGGKFVEQFNNYQLLKNDSVKWSWLVGWLVGWLDSWLVGWLVGWLEVK